MAPVRISLDALKKEPDQQMFNRSFLPVAVLLEGKFSSVYNNRIPDTIAQDKGIGFRSESKPNKMIVIADGDIIKNQLRNMEGQSFYLPLGYDRYTNKTFGNKNFILNAIDYLCDDSGLISVRSRELKLRLLNVAEMKNNRVKWQTINTAIPVLLILLMALVKEFIRKRLYAKKANLKNQA